jgi:diguanylate cyclase (GGDEF)-like protein
MIPEGRCYTFLILSGAAYCFGYAGEMSQTSLSQAEFWLHVEYLGIPWLPPLWILSARLYRGLNGDLPVLFVIPVLTFVGQMTNSLHGLYVESYGIVQRGPFWVITMQRGPLCWLHLGYLYFSMFYGAWLILYKPQRAGRTHLHSLLMVGALLAPHTGYMIYLLGFSPYGLDLAPLLLGISVLLGYIGIFHFGAFELVPMARSLVFEHMHDGVIVLNPQRRLVDFNRAAQAIFPAIDKTSLGLPVDEVLDSNSDAIRALTGREGVELLDLRRQPQKRYFEVRTSVLSSKNVHLGSASILTDITRQMEMLNELQYHAETDPLTGLANRRVFLEAIQRNCARATRYGEPLTLALIDVDRFKSVNDMLGHTVGDNVLLAVADRLIDCKRSADLLSRYGGDEFALLLPQTGSKKAQEVAERLCHAVADSIVEAGGEEPISVSLSIGLATLEPGQEPDWNALLKRADKALYEAKAQGRNRVAAWK